MHWIALALTAVFVAFAQPVSAAAPSPKPTGSAAPATTSRQKAVPLTAVAPADAYFGSFGMSPLSIRSTIGLLGREYHYRTISDHDLLRKALITEDALRRWRTKYPADPWLAPTFFHLEQLYQSVQTDEARKHASAILKDVVQNYPTTKEGHMSRARLAAGFPALTPESPVAEASPAASPTDTQSPAPDLAGSPSAAPNSPAAPANASPAPAGTPAP